MEKFKSIFITPYRGLRKEIYAIFFARMINASGLFVFPLITLLFTEKIGMSLSQAGLYVAVIGFMFMPMSLIGGKLSDKFSRVKIIVIFDTLAMLIYIVCSQLEPSMTMVWLMMGSAALLGISDPAHSAIIADYSHPDQRNTAYSLTYLGFNIGFIIGPVIGSLLFENHLRWFFFIDGVTMALAILLVFLFVRGKRYEAETETEMPHEGSIIQVLIERPKLVIFALILLGYHFVYSQWGFMVPVASETFFAHGTAFYGKLASVNGLVVMIFTPLLTLWFKGMENLRRIVIGGLLYTLGFGLFGILLYRSGYVLGVAVFTLGEVLITISYMPYIISQTPISHRGRMSAILPIAIGLGYTIGPIIMGRVTEVIGLENGFKMLSGVMLFFTGCMFLLSVGQGKTEKIT